MAVIEVAGEKYKDLDALRIEIDVVEATLEEMPSDTPEHENLAQHLKKMRAAAAEATGGSEDNAVSSEPSPPAATPPEEEAEEEVETTTSLRDASDTGKALVCPLCGHDIDFPETPPLDAFSHKCDKCDGWGQVMTGSRVDGHVWRDCKECQGSGFVENQAQTYKPTVTGAAPTPEAPGAIWEPLLERWSPPAGQQPPWAGAVWDDLLGKWS